MHLGSGRWRESDENHDAITTGISTKVDINIGFPVVDGPNVASLIDDHVRPMLLLGKVALGRTNMDRI